MTDNSTLSEPARGVLGPVIDAHDGFVLVLDDDGSIREFDERFAEVVGQGTEIGGAPLSEHALDPESVTAAVSTALSDGSATVSVLLGEPPPDRHELRFAATEDGQRIVVLGGPLPTPATVDDDRVLDRMTDALFALDESYRITYVNDEARPILSGAMGVEEDAEMVGRDLWEAIPDAVGTPFYEHYTTAMERQEPVTFEAEYEPLGLTFEVRAYPSESGLSVYFRDVTDRRQRREALAERERTLREMYDITNDTGREFEQQVDALLRLAQELLDADYGVLSRIEGEEYVHEVARSPGGVIDPGMRIPLSATVCERTAAEQRRVVLADIVKDAPEVADRIEDSEFDWDWPVSCYVGAPVVVDGDVYGTFCFYDGQPREDGFSEWETTVVEIMAQWIGYELTKQRVTEQLRAQNEQLDQFVSVVSHDLRNPLETLSGHLELAEETGDAEHFEWCRWAIRRMDGLIDDLLALAKAGEEVGETEPVQLDDLVRECWAIVDYENARLVVETDRTIEADRSRLRQIVENLLRNAVAHGGEGVTVSVGATPDGFYIEDDGPGVPPDQRERVFETGHTTSEDGTGFGLNIVKQVAEAHGWSVELTESAEGGARFEFTV